MAQMVLPQTPAPGSQKDPGPSKAGPNRDPADRKNDFESVSQAEKKRLDRQKADRDAAAKAEDAARSDRPESPQRAAREDQPDSGAPADKPTGGAQKDADDAASVTSTLGSEGTTPESIEAGAVLLPLTFVELQSLVNPQAVPTAGPLTATGAPGVAGAQPGVQAPSAGTTGLFAGLLGATGEQKPGMPAGTAGAEGAPVDSLKAALVSDLGRNGDTGSLQTSGRFQGALDMLSQQSASNNAANAGAARLTADTAAPLRGYATSIDVPVGHAEWGDKLVGKLSWLTARNLSVAEIHLTPPDMGPMEVKVRVQNEQASITVHSANPVVRDQLELHSHRLRDMLGEQGLSLAGFDVADSSQQQAGDQEPGDSRGAGTATAGVAEGDPEDGAHAAHHLDLSWKGEIDIFA